jgi:hypothetical protein
MHVEPQRRIHDLSFVRRDNENAQPLALLRHAQSPKELTDPPPRAERTDGVVAPRHVGMGTPSHNSSLKRSRDEVPVLVHVSPSSTTERERKSQSLDCHRLLNRRYGAIHRPDAPRVM